MAKIVQLKGSDGLEIYPVIAADAIYMKDGTTVEEKFNSIDHVGGSSAHSVEDKRALGKLLITLNTGTQYLISREEYVAPAVPTFRPAGGGSGDGSLGVTISTATSGATVQYKVGDKGDWTTGTSVTLSQDTSVQSKSYTVSAKAMKNGIESAVVSASYTVNRRVAAPTITADNTNKYAASHVVTIVHATADTLYYTTDGSNPTTSSPTITSGGTITLSTAGTYTVKVLAVKANWVSNSATKSGIIVGAKKCYIGQAESVTSEENIKALANSYERDTLVGLTVDPIDFGTTTQYVWFAIPSTEEKNLTVKSNGFAVTLNKAAGTVIDNSYRVWRTANKINDSFTFQFS